MLYELSRTVSAYPQTVFNTVADIMDWPRIIEGVRSVELLTTGPIRVGTKLRLKRVLFGHEMISEVEVAALDPPRRLRLLAQGGEFPYELDHQIDAVYMVGTRLMLIFQTMPDSTAERTALAFITPVVWTSLRGELERDLDDLVTAIPDAEHAHLG